MLTLIVNATPASDAEQTCPICGKPAKLNEIVRSAHHVLGCRRCYGTSAVDHEAVDRDRHQMDRPVVMVTRRLEGLSERGI